jgi:hypothetical protein
MTSKTEYMENLHRLPYNFQKILPMKVVYLDSVESAMKTMENITERELDLHCTFDLESRQLEAFWQHFSDNLEHNPFLIRLKCTNFSLRGITALAEMLLLNSTVTTLVIENNLQKTRDEFKQEGIYTVANMLLGNSSITVLDLSENRIGK